MRWLSGSTRAGELKILAYHRVYPLSREDEFPSDPELVSADVEAFAAQMSFVRRHFAPLTFAEVIRSIDSGRRLPTHAVIVTFDDGHLDNYTHAFPILRQLGVPATIFLSTGYIGTDDRFWFERLASLIYCAPPGPFEVESMSFRYLLHDVASRRRASDLLLARLKNVHDSVRREAVGEVEARLALHLRAAESACSSALSWQSVEEMAREGIEFGSHGVTHSVLSNLDPDDLRAELFDSRRVIQQHTGQEVEVIAYPIGKSTSYNARVIDAARECGYRVGVTYESGTNLMAAMDPFVLKRIPVERTVSQKRFEAMLCFPRAFF